MKKFWFLSIRAVTVYIDRMFTQHTHSDAFAQTKKNSHKKSTKYKEIHPNNTSKPAFLCKVGGEANVLKKNTNGSHCISCVCAGVINIHRILIKSQKKPKPQLVLLKRELNRTIISRRMNHRVLAVLVWSPGQQAAAGICSLNGAR